MLPDPPLGSRLREIGIREDELCVVPPSETWWRVHRTEGAFVLAWNEFRHYGPVLRFDPHPEPAREHADCAVWYGAATLDAAIAEAFQGDRTIDRVRDRPYLTGLAFTRPLHLLDLAVDSSGAWATRAGGNFAISTAAHGITQRWARAIVESFPDLDGVRYNSRFAGHTCAALFLPAATAMPGRPIISLPLTHPALVSRLAGAARRLGYSVI
ncbi:RES family NAD+ phosphorylase [Mycobacterium frederiksbergense]|uniref:RES family NAD+ phosphorylase n=1 Tax=Mycolicibacterium frederiksbergense TaxID=117567 RepID=UPI0021F385C9|nr:RES family NAD+ phosphorylase [Mycolicibacterium frederiksbergense]MCV7048373.1 RES family NAD+ phosphorylase [Mycolicibacterium frederiksbergense]